MSRGLLVMLLLAVVLALSAPRQALAADPTLAPSPGPSPVLIDPLDPRGGEGASQVGAPLVALVIVVGLGLAAVAATVIYAGLWRRT